MIRSTRTRALTACALFLVLTGCASGSGQGSRTPAPEASEAVPAAADSNADPLERIPDRPFPDEIPPEETLETLLDWQEDQKKEWAEAGWGEPGLLVKLGPDQEGAEMNGAFRTVHQVVWTGAERDTVFHGTNAETLSGTMKDIEHFVAPSALESYMGPAREALQHLESKEAGKDPELPEGTTYSYKLHPGTIASSEPAATEADEAAWPEYANSDDNEEATVWLGIPDPYGNSTKVPVMHGAETRVMDFNIYSVEDAPAEQDPTHAVIVHSSLTLRTQLADDRPVDMHLYLQHQVGLEGDVWKIQASEWKVDVINGDVSNPDE